MMYLQYLWHKFKKHLHNYKEFSEYIKLINTYKSIEKARSKEYQERKKSWLKVRGAMVGTLSELTEQNQRFEEEHPDLFPGLKAMESPEPEIYDTYLNTFKIKRN